MSYLQYSTKTRTKLEKELTAFFAKKQSQTMSIRFYADVLDKLRRFSLAGKLMRGIFVMTTYDMCSGNKPHIAIRAACAIEIVHTGLLIHDDIMDRDELRRGLRTIYMQYSDDGTLKKIDNPKEYGRSMGISAGDVAFFLAIELLMTSAAIAPHAQKLIKKISTEMVQLGVAQMEDVYMGSISASPSPKEIIEMYRYKSARYSFSLPFEMGALLAGAPASTCGLLTKLGEQIGIIFQLKDDEIGLFGTSKNIGKSVGIDIRSNKKTLHRHHCYQKASVKEKHILNKIFGNPNATQTDIEYVLGIMVKYNIREYLETIMLPYEKEAYRLIGMLKRRGLNTDILRGIVELNMNRTR